MPDHFHQGMLSWSNEICEESHRPYVHTQHEFKISCVQDSDTLSAVPEGQELVAVSFLEKHDFVTKVNGDLNSSNPRFEHEPIGLQQINKNYQFHEYCYSVPNSLALHKFCDSNSGKALLYFLLVSYFY